VIAAMPASFDLRGVSFLDRDYLWLLVLPACFMALWIWRIGRRWQDAGRLKARRLPVGQSFPWFGHLLFWFCAILATSCAIVALARPVVVSSSVRTAGVDLIILQDGSASMRVQDVAGDRWRRSMRFLRALGESLRWKEDRIAMALFAHIATPQIRLTKDPNTFFFFLDHLDRTSPFRQEDDATWDTNIELGIYWGVRLAEKDSELNGRSTNAQAFVVLSDGEAWSGEVERSLQLAVGRDIPVFVVGVGTAAGGLIPSPESAAANKPMRSSLDRTSLMRIAAEGGGRYFQLDRDADSTIANTIIDLARRRAGSRGLEATAVELYWPCLAAAVWLVALGAVFLTDRIELWLQAAGTGAALLLVWMLTR
jgi:hypothetical protein